ncbi:MAG: tetratricopeptide repeat protein [Pseudomonadota bacterium]
MSLLGCHFGVANAQTASAERDAYPDGAYAFALGDFEASRALFASECTSGNIKSCLRAADDYRVGRGGPQDYDEAIRFAGIACRNGDADGCTVSATIHFEGRATGTPDYEAAREAYSAACALSDPRGCAGLGNMQYIGLGGLRERFKGAENLRRACRQDFEYACEQLRGYGQNR